MHGNANGIFGEACFGCHRRICDEPTRGIDVGAKFEVYRLLGELAADGKDIVVVSSDLKELLALCDRIAVMSAGKLVTEFRVPLANRQKTTLSQTGVGPS
jgi:ABC-type sugar transport system ATPase subunit